MRVLSCALSALALLLFCGGCSDVIGPLDACSAQSAIHVVAWGR